MTKRGISLNPGYRPGSHWAVCDSCGFQFRAEDLRQTWDNHWVCSDDFEVRHPQDFLRVKAEKIIVTQPIRYDDTDNLIGMNFFADTAVAGRAVAGIAVAGQAVPETQSIPSGTFDNTL